MTPPPGAAYVKLAAAVVSSSTLDLLPTFSRTTRRYSNAATWVLSSEIRLQSGFASASRLMLLGFHKLALSRQRLAFMVTTEGEALEGLARTQPGLLIVTNQLEQGSGLALVEAARDLVEDIRTILIVNPRIDDLVAAGRSRADAVLAESDCFTAAKPVVALSRSIAIGQRYRSPAVLAAMEGAAVQRQPWRDGPPQLSARELMMVELLVQGLSDREAAEQMGLTYEGARSLGKTLRRKLGAGSRGQAVAKALQLGLARLGGY
jgi:DNA-binding NarL/FixJ family response regulator